MGEKIWIKQIEKAAKKLAAEKKFQSKKVSTKKSSAGKKAGGHQDCCRDDEVSQGRRKEKGRGEGVWLLGFIGSEGCISSNRHDGSIVSVLKECSIDEKYK